MAMAIAQWLYGKSIYVGSAGVNKGELDPFAVAAMEEIGLDIAVVVGHSRRRDLADLFKTVICLGSGLAKFDGVALFGWFVRGLFVE